MEHTNRNSNFEFLRILSMFMIVFIHANMYLSNFCKGKAFVFFNGFVNGISNIGVTCFILISGYFGLKFSLRKLLKMEIMMITFSFLETIILLWLMPQEMMGATLLEQIIKSCFPVITRKYWFYSCYVCLFLLSGYINSFLNSLKQEEFKKLLGTMLLLFSVCPTLFYFEIIQDHGKGLIQMILIYMLGQYIRKYGFFFGSKGRNRALFLGLWLLNGVSHEIPIQLGGIYHHLCKDNSITNIIMAIILFYEIKEWNIHSSIINKCSKNIFAVFALNNTIVTVMMYYVIKVGKLQPMAWQGFLILTVVVACVMIFCLFLGYLREIMIGKIENHFLEKICKVVSYGK